MSVHHSPVLMGPRLCMQSRNASTLVLMCAGFETNARELLSFLAVFISTSDTTSLDTNYHNNGRRSEEFGSSVR